jgi:hypothetical protein
VPDQSDYRPPPPAPSPLNEPLPLKPADPPPERRLDEHHPTPAPAWAALLAAWLGMLALIASIVFLFLPGSGDPKAELQHARPYSPKDRFLPVPVYGVALALFVGIAVLWQMRKEPRPLPDALAAQQLQARVGITLALVAGVIVYGYVAVFGPK